MSGPVMRLLRVFTPDRRHIALAAGLQFGTIAAGVALMATSAWLIARAALHPSIAVLSVAVVGVRAFGIARGVLRYLERLVAHDLTLRLLTRVRTWLYDALEPLAPARLIERRSGDLLARVVSDVDALEPLYVRLIGPTIAAALVVAFTAALLARWDGTIAVAAALALPVGGLGASWLAWRAGRHAGERAVDLRSDIEARVIDGVHGLPELLAFNGSRTHAEALARDGERLAAVQRRAAAAGSLGGALVGLAADGAALVVVALAVTAARANTLDGVQIAVVTLLVLAAFEAVVPLPVAWQALGGAREAAARMFELVDIPPAVRPPAHPVPAPAGSRLDVEAVSFTYPGEARSTLDQVSVSLGPGRLVAIVGPSGSGKSTLAHLVLRFWDVSSGRILLDGIDVRELHPDEARARIAFVAQRTHLFSGTLLENLLIARPTACRADVTSAVRRAGLEGLVQQLPQGLATWIGEQGLQLSGGERQRLALARALLKRASLLVLDEPTAHVDPITERTLLTALREEARQKGVLLVTHRLQSLRVADEIVVLDEGRVAERGSYDDLVASGGWFRDMLRLQAAALLREAGADSPSGP